MKNKYWAMKLLKCRSTKPQTNSKVKVQKVQNAEIIQIMYLYFNINVRLFISYQNFSKNIYTIFIGIRNTYMSCFYYIKVVNSLINAFVVCEFLNNA